MIHMKIKKNLATKPISVIIVQVIQIVTRQIRTC